jgi:hypothetical protein
MQKYRFQIWLLDVDGADFDIQFVGAGDDGGEGFFGLRHHQQYGMIVGGRLDHAGQAAQIAGQPICVDVFTQVQAQSLVLTDGLGQLFLRAEGNHLTVVDDANPVRELLSFFHIMGSVEHGQALLVELFDCV